MDGCVIPFLECHRSCLAGGSSLINSLPCFPFLFPLPKSPEDQIPAFCVAIKCRSLKSLLPLRMLLGSICKSPAISKCPVSPLSSPASGPLAVYLFQKPPFPHQNPLLGLGSVGKKF